VHQEDDDDDEEEDEDDEDDDQEGGHEPGRRIAGVFGVREEGEEVEEAGEGDIDDDEIDDIVRAIGEAQLRIQGTADEEERASLREFVAHLETLRHELARR
jgi:hypothetical protein